MDGVLRAGPSYVVTATEKDEDPTIGEGQSRSSFTDSCRLRSKRSNIVDTFCEVPDIYSCGIVGKIQPQRRGR